MNYKIDISFLVLFLLILLVSCNESSDPKFDIFSPDNVFEGDDPEPVPNLIIESDKIICEFCDGFGTIIETSENQIIVGGLKKIWIFERNGQSTTLVQEIALGGLLGLNSITAKDDELFLGVHNEFGDGSLQRYLKMGSDWEFEQTYEIGRRLDNFGNDVDLSDTYMVIGASAVWSNSVNTGNADAGSFYVYAKEGSDWNLIIDFFAENSFADDRFGSDVIIWDNFILAGGLSIPLHIYNLESETWSLLRVEESILTADIAHNENNFIYYSEEFGLQSFRMNSDASMQALNVNATLDLSGGMRFSGDNMSMINGFVLIGTLGGQELYLLKLIGNEWVLENTFAPSSETQFEYLGVKLTPELALMGGNDSSNGTSYLFIEEY